MKSYEELDYKKTPLGELILRRRLSPSVPDEPVYEVKLADQMLMSSVVNASERALARIALEQLGHASCDVLVGGLGLGYTALAALEFSRVERLDVVENLEPVISWHRRRLVPVAGTLLDDPRCSLIQDDFFAFVAPGGPGGRYDAVLLDIDHSPESLLHEQHGGFYTEAGLRGLASHLNPGGVFGLWSASEPSAGFLGVLQGVASTVYNHKVAFRNPHLGITDTNWVVVAGGFG